MYACYIDESGHCGQKLDPQQPVEVVVGVLNDLVSKLPKTQRELLDIINDLTRLDIKVRELKAADAYRGRKAWSGVSAEIRKQVFREVLEFAKERSCKYLIAPIDSAKFFERKRQGCSIAARLAYPYEAGAMNIVLGVQRMQKSAKNNKGRTFVVFDEQQGHDTNLKKILLNVGELDWTDPYTGYVVKKKAKKQEPRLDQIFDIPYFSPSHGSIVIQLADWAAFVVNRYLQLTAYCMPESYEGELATVTEWYDLIGTCKVNHTAMEPPGAEEICCFFREVRPEGWSMKGWSVERACGEDVLTVEGAIQHSSALSASVNTPP